MCDRLRDNQGHNLEAVTATTATFYVVYVHHVLFLDFRLRMSCWKCFTSFASLKGFAKLNPHKSLTLL